VAVIRLGELQIRLNEAADPEETVPRLRRAAVGRLGTVPLRDAAVILLPALWGVVFTEIKVLAADSDDGQVFWLVVPIRWRFSSDGRHGDL
jgi:hypothetical protein